tara:strand:+ start:11480 stop:12112 length:633 start_codon:yes stop_codon:yes gene_type:complete
MRKKLNNASISISPIINIKSQEKTMELYKIYTKNNKLKLVYPKSLAMQIMSEMKVGEKFYFDVTEERARQWCKIYQRKQWHHYRDVPNYILNNENYPKVNPDKVKRRLHVVFKVRREGALRCIEKVKSNYVYTDKKFASQYKEAELITPIQDAEFSVRTHNCLLNAGFKYLEEIMYIPESRLLTYKNMGRKSAREIREKLNEYKQIKETK